MIEFITDQRTEVAFYCTQQGCHEIVRADVPEPGEKITRSYCCKAQYEVSSNVYGELAIIRIKDRKIRHNLKWHIIHWLER